ncbi:MAG TPA: glycine--tRNA ligase subunit beta [Rhodocyclaceae bacterium]|nr:glycine--tRNA ligase subunit beta [Rhodocyclaceae bacterium]
MSTRANLLIELRTEELPPRSLVRLATAFAGALDQALREADFIGGDGDRRAPRVWATPRRLAVLCADVLAMQPDRLIERKGPAVANGLDADGRPTKALEGFMRSAGVSFEQLVRVAEGKAEYFVARTMRTGDTLDRHLARLVEGALKRLPVAKLMRWGAGDAEFVRPVHGLVMIHGERIVEGEVLGIASGRRTLGHRFLAEGEIEIGHADQYETLLAERGRVIADAEVRRARIAAELDAAARREHGVWIGHRGADPQTLLDLSDETRARSSDLLDEVVALVEWPRVYVGAFDEEFLSVPMECLILTMQQNQKYFPLLTREGRLLPRFLIVSNMDIDDPGKIVTGNERVVRPRLADARFFFEQDRKRPLASRLPELEQVVFHNKLGTLGARATRIGRLARTIATQLASDPAAAERAGLLAKADLVTGMVGEFPELQGTMGRYYAEHDGEGAHIARAIEEHYRPRHAGDTLPTGNLACAVALADKLDALSGFFGIGALPTGDKDPFALRRAALGVLRILMETPLALDLGVLIDRALAGYEGTGQHGEVREGLLDFMFERLRHSLREARHPLDQVEAVLALRPTRIDQIPARLDAVRDFLALPEAAALAAAYKRIANILKKAREKSETLPDEPDVALFVEPAERTLFETLIGLVPKVHSFLAAEDYTDALTTLASLRAPVDRLFDEVMVMTDEPLLRGNRLALLDGLGRIMNQVADLSRLAIDK